MVFKSKSVYFLLCCTNGSWVTSQSGFVGGQCSVNALVRDVKKRNNRVTDSFIIGIIVVPS